MLENFSLDIVNLMLFTMPGFFFLKGMKYKTDSDLTYFMYSMFWGVLLMVFVYNFIFTIDKLEPLLENPRAGSIIFSVIAWIVGRFLILLISKIPIRF